MDNSYNQEFCMVPDSHVTQVLFMFESWVITKKCFRLSYIALKQQYTMFWKGHLNKIWLELSFTYQKAYDVLNHTILLSKSDAYGIRGIVNLWFKSYLWNRKQPVETNYDDSNSLQEDIFLIWRKLNIVRLNVQSLAQFCFYYT
jgi:hypothetical protein